MRLPLFWIGMSLFLGGCTGYLVDSFGAGASQPLSCSGPSPTITTNRTDVVVGGTVSLSASGGTPPYTFSATGGGSAAATTFTAGSTPGRSTITVSDASLCTASTKVTVRAAQGNFVVGVTQTLWMTGAGIYAYQLDYGSNAITALAHFTYSFPPNVGIRAMAIDLNDHLYAGFFNATPYAYTLTNSTPYVATIASPAITLNPFGATFPQLHALCFLPDGTFVAGSYPTGADTVGFMNQYDAAGNYLRAVYSSQIATGTSIGVMSDCHAFSATKIFLLDAKSIDNNNGEIVELDLAGGVWSASTNRTGPMATYNSSIGKWIWRMVVHPDGYVYIPPQLSDAASSQTMVRCTPASLPQASCIPIGTTFPSTAMGDYTEGAQLIPGTNDILVLTALGYVVRYNYLTQTYTQLLAFSAGGVGVSLIPNFVSINNAVAY